MKQCTNLSSTLSLDIFQQISMLEFKNGIVEDMQKYRFLKLKYTLNHIHYTALIIATLNILSLSQTDKHRSILLIYYFYIPLPQRYTIILTNTCT